MRHCPRVYRQPLQRHPERRRVDPGDRRRWRRTRVRYRRRLHEGEGQATISQPVPSVGSGLPNIIGRYTVAVALLRQVAPPPALPQSIGDALPVSNKTIDYGNEYENLGIVNIAVR